MNFQVLKTLFFNTFQKELRSKALLFFFFLSLTTILGVNAVFSLISSFTDQIPTFVSEYKLSALYYIVSIWGGILGIILGVGCIKSDMNFGVAQQIIAFPVRPFMYMLVRILGTWVMVNAYYLLTLITALIIFTVTDGKFIIGLNIFYSFCIFSIVILISITLAAFFSMHFTKITSFITTIMFYFIIQGCNSLFITPPIYQNMEIASSIGLAFHLIFPRIGVINSISNSLFMGRGIQLDLLPQIIHFFVSYGLLLFVLFISFKKRDYES